MQMRGGLSLLFGFFAAVRTVAAVYALTLNRFISSYFIVVAFALLQLFVGVFSGFAALNGFNRLIFSGFFCCPIDFITGCSRNFFPADRNFAFSGLGADAGRLWFWFFRNHRRERISSSSLICANLIVIGLAGGQLTVFIAGRSASCSLNLFILPIFAGGPVNLVAGNSGNLVPFDCQGIVIIVRHTSPWNPLNHFVQITQLSLGSAPVQILGAEQGIAVTSIGAEDIQLICQVGGFLLPAGVIVVFNACPIRRQADVHRGPVLIKIFPLLDPACEHVRLSAGTPLVGPVNLGHDIVAISR